MRSPTHPPDNRHCSEVKSSITFAAMMIAIAMTFFNSLLGAARILGRVIVPDSTPHLALAGGSPMGRAHPGLLHKAGSRGFMFDLLRAGRSHRRGTMGRRAGLFGGGGNRFRS